MDRTQLLVILDGERSAQTLTALRGHHQISQVGSPRVVVVEPDDGGREQLAGVPGVDAVVGPGEELPPGLVETLGTTDHLFAQAWVLRMKEAPAKDRPGEGRSWGDPGFLPPDPPDSDTA